MSGFFVSTKQALIIGLLFAVIVVFVGLMAGLIQETCPEVSSGDDPATTTTTTTTASTTGDPITQPWLNPFLPSATEPVHFDLWLYPDFYWDGSTFQGRVDIEIDIKEPTRYLIVHQKYLTFSNSKVTMKTGEVLAINSEFKYDDNEFYVVEVDRTLDIDCTVILHLEFTGSLVNGIVGFYKSNYTNTITGERRSAISGPTAIFYFSKPKHILACYHSVKDICMIRSFLSSFPEHHTRDHCTLSMSMHISKVKRVI